MLHSMESELRVRFSNTNAYEMVGELKALFASQVRVMKCEYLDKFLSMKMEENTCLESHLATMHRIHGCLTTDSDYWMTDEIAIDGVLSSLPPSYKDFVIGYVMRGESFTFHEFLTRLRTVKVDPVAVEVIDGEGIFDIQVINVFMLNTYSSLLSIWYSFRFYWKQDLLRESCMEEVMVRVDGKQDVDGRRRSPFTFIIWISDRNKFCNHFDWGPYWYVLHFVRQVIHM